MTLDNNALGQRGENAVAAHLLRPIRENTIVPSEPFSVEIFGGKHELFDGIVYLRDHQGKLTGAHFFIQIKTSAPTSDTDKCSARFSKEEVANAISFKIPVYLIGVEARKKETCFVAGISHSRTKGFTRIDKAKGKLSNVGVLRRIYSEVLAYHSAIPTTFSSGV